MSDMTSHTPISWARTLNLPFSRDQLMLLMVALNLIFLGIDTYLSHIIGGTIVTREWIPIVFGFIGGSVMFVAGIVALRNRPLATVLATITLAGSIVVGLLGAYYHLSYAARPEVQLSERLTLDLLVWAPPVLGPMAFVMVGVLGISAAWIEYPVDSGSLVLLGGLRLHLPYSKTRAYFYIIGMGTLAALVSSVLDHARTGFDSIWLWAPTLIGVFAMVAAVAMAAVRHPSQVDVWTYGIAMVLLVLLGPLGVWRHVESNFVGDGVFVIERFIRGAPFLAPMLFSNMGLLGLIVLLDPREILDS